MRRRLERLVRLLRLRLRALRAFGLPLRALRAFGLPLRDLRAFRPFRLFPPPAARPASTGVLKANAANRQIVPIIRPL